MFPIIGHGLVEAALVRGVIKLIEFEIGVALFVDLVVKGGYDLIFLFFVKGAEGNHRIALPEILLLVFQQRAEHAAVQHVVGIDDAVAAFRVADCVNEGKPGEAVANLKIGVEIPLRFVGGVHDGVVDSGSRNGKPARKIGIFLVQLQKAGKDFPRLCGRRGRGGDGRDDSGLGLDGDGWLCQGGGGSLRGHPLQGNLVAQGNKHRHAENQRRYQRDDEKNSGNGRIFPPLSVSGEVFSIVLVGHGKSSSEKAVTGVPSPPWLGLEIL